VYTTALRHHCSVEKRCPPELKETRWRPPIIGSSGWVCSGRFFLPARFVRRRRRPPPHIMLLAAINTGPIHTQSHSRRADRSACTPHTAGAQRMHTNAAAAAAQRSSTHPERLHACIHVRLTTSPLTWWDGLTQQQRRLTTQRPGARRRPRGTGRPPAQKLRSGANTTAMIF
jgi:hypothetical protein